MRWKLAGVHDQTATVDIDLPHLRAGRRADGCYLDQLARPEGAPVQHCRQPGDEQHTGSNCQCARRPPPRLAGCEVEARTDSLPYARRGPDWPDALCKLHEILFPEAAALLHEQWSCPPLLEAAPRRPAQCAQHILGGQGIDDSRMILRSHVRTPDTAAGFP